MEIPTNDKMLCEMLSKVFLKSTNIALTIMLLSIFIFQVSVIESNRPSDDSPFVKPHCEEGVT